jgi:predicted nucleotidyltransferase
VSLDILLFPPIDPAAMCQRAIKLDVAGVPVVLATIDDLITLKQSAGRPIDLLDIEHLHRIDKPGAIPP